MDRELVDMGQELLPELQAGTLLIPDRVELLKRMPKGCAVAEVGVAHGDFSQEILRHCSPKKFHLIDLWSDTADGDATVEDIKTRFAEEIAAGIVELKRGWSWEMLDSFPDSTLDWVYIDAGHDYESVSKDLGVCRRKVKRDGLICGHDYTLWSGKGLYRFGVVEAVNEFCNKHTYELLYLTNERNRHCSYGIGHSSADVQPCMNNRT